MDSLAAGARSGSVLPFRRTKRRKEDDKQLSLNLWPCPVAAETADLLARLLNLSYNEECRQCGGCRRAHIKHYIAAIARDFWGG